MPKYPSYEKSIGGKIWQRYSGPHNKKDAMRAADNYRYGVRGKKLHARIIKHRGQYFLYVLTSRTKKTRF